MALQNIGAGNRDDAFYRYKMPRMVTKIEGRGNGIKTNVVNMVDIAKALARPAAYITKYFGCELGAQSKFDEKTGVSLVNGAHDAQKLSALLEAFIKRYVQCYGCGNPETDVAISKTQTIALHCAACGFVSDVDMRDKLTTFDKKEMRRAEKERLRVGEAADEGQKKLRKETRRRAPPVASKKHGSSEDENGDDEEVQWQTDTSLEAARQRIHEQLTAPTAEMVKLSIAGEPPKRIQKQQPPEATKKSKESNGHAPAEAAASEAHKALTAEMKAELDKKGATPRRLAAALAAAKAGPQPAMDALFEAACGGAGRGMARELAKRTAFLGAVAHDAASQLRLLRAMEAFCGRAGADASKEVALAAKALYDADVVEEGCIVCWYEAGLAGAARASPVWKNLKPFIDWLQSAESESESNE
ncbi:unnamed protein product [Spirodela intermedia]|uniref:W2 domain-containing protein n=1 Tax=Spirodela intermedia TaxID=51605 RepID=A0A7I8IWZ0_SPIIN|nr:unnamed protein product [Spirodela intermedia]CAA6661500.1 unnamed protein product [Spirodela intermedia]